MAGWSKYRKICTRSVVKKSTLLLSGPALRANNQPNGSRWKYGLIAGTCTAVCKKRWTATKEEYHVWLTHEVVQRFLEWDSLHYIPNHAKQDSLVIHRHDERTTLRTSPRCRKYQNGLVTLVHQPLASSFNYFLGFPLGAHLPGQQLSPSSMKALLSFPTALPPTWLMAGLWMSCWLGPQAESRYVSSLGVIDFIHFIQVSRNDDTERIWLTTSKCKHFLYKVRRSTVCASCQICHCMNSGLLLCVNPQITSRLHRCSVDPISIYGSESPTDFMNDCN